MTDVIKRRKKIRRKAKIRKYCFIISVLIVAFGLVFGGLKVFEFLRPEKTDKLITLNDKEVERIKNIKLPNYVTVDIIHKHNTARSGKNISKINDIVIHYVGNPGSTAKNNRDYFDKEDTEVSSHFVVGLDGEAIQCIPLWEKSSASNWRNSDTISIEVCHPDESGKFNDTSYQTVIKLTAFLCEQFNLTEKDVIRHYDITGKLCPKYYVEHEDKWDQLKIDVGNKINEDKKK